MATGQRRRGRARRARLAQGARHRAHNGGGEIKLLGMMASGADVKKRIFRPPASACSADLGFLSIPAEKAGGQESLDGSSVSFAGRSRPSIDWLSYE